MMPEWLLDCRYLRHRDELLCCLKLWNTLVTALLVAPYFLQREMAPSVAWQGVFLVVTNLMYLMCTPFLQMVSWV